MIGTIFDQEQHGDISKNSSNFSVRNVIVQLAEAVKYGDREIEQQQKI